MKRKKLDHARLSRNLGSTIRGTVQAPAGYFGALQLADGDDGRPMARKASSGGLVRGQRRESVAVFVIGSDDDLA